MENKEDYMWIPYTIGMVMIPVSFVASLLTDNPHVRLFVMIFGIISFIALATSSEVKGNTKEESTKNDKSY